ncbi:MAG: DUF1343 domain-containing protein [Flavobacteriales bacterium TMED191]|nr:MAG: DUF1343 domain-containing protein [Flavobacteriales bacterium TMED191]|tara:strand:+ start:273 stop:1430 length:1158 start_codon:yes stop_codon:yes gene_type:complete
MKLKKFIFFIYSLCCVFNLLLAQKPGIYDIDNYINKLKNKNIGLVVNHSSVLNKTHLVDTLLSLSIDINYIFSPEHGFGGNFNAGEYVENSEYNGIPTISLYGKNKEIQDIYLQDIDVILFDLQDVGVRFYTYISTLHYVMEACAKNDVNLIVLDRPNPHANYVDGPLLDKNFASFVGMHEVPVVYGMTIGEYSLMINGEGWLQGSLVCSMEVVENIDYNRSSKIKYEIPPSPNLRSLSAILLYPSLCFFEGTVVSVGRGTNQPFQIYGAPFFDTNYQFIPRSNFGANNPKYNNEKCFGFDLRNYYLDNDVILDQINLDFLINSYRLAPKNIKSEFFNSFFNTLAGNDKLQMQLINNVSIIDIRESWAEDIKEFKLIRSKYLLYN